jgi:AraC family transcriptional regulator, dual regulator of chb operon
MQVPKYLAEIGIDSQTEIHYRLITSIRNASPLHTHDFYEFFLVLVGKAVHRVNNKRDTLEDGTLVFIRPDDFHYYEPISGYDFQFINLSFYIEIMEGLFNYLGNGFRKDELLQSELPPKVILSPVQTEYLKNRLEHLNLIPYDEKNVIRTEGRAIISEILSKYFLDYKNENGESLPEVLSTLTAAMKNKENFILGLPALLSISGITHEHMCRLFKKYLQLTPTEYINNLRLDYAENLLLNSDMEIIDICFNSGFENLGYFYKLFKVRFKTTPYAYRRRNKKEFTEKIITK